MAFPWPRIRNPRIAVPWADLPPEVLDEIAKRLPAEIDVRRFRAVCNPWRSSTRPYRFPTIKLPFPFKAEENSGPHFILTERIIYRIQLPDSKNPAFWLVKVEHLEDGKVRVINPVTHRKVEISPAIKMPESLNILDFDVSEVCKAYALRYVNPSKLDERDDYYDYRHAKKVVYCANVDNGEYVVMAIDLEGRLWKMKLGDTRWTLLRISNRFSNFYPLFYDVAVIKGQFQAMDLKGAIWSINDKNIWRSGFYTKHRRALKRRFVDLVDGGEVVVVEEMGDTTNGPLSRNFRNEEPVVDVGVYAFCNIFNQWVDVKARYGCIIVVGDDCSFSVSGGDGLKAARVFFTDRYSFFEDEVFNLTGDPTFYECDCLDICNCLDWFDFEPIEPDDPAATDDVRREFDGFYAHSIGVCDVEAGITGTALKFPEYASIFWPPPAWLCRG